MENKAIKCVKGFDKYLTCKGFQYEIGKEYETDSIEICRKGFHAIDETESPLSVFKYYPPCCSDGTPNRFCLVELSGETMKEGDKTVGSKIKIVEEIGIEGVIDLHREWAKTHSVNDGDSFKHSVTNTGDFSSASNTGNYSLAANTGTCSSASNTGDFSSAINTGDYSSASDTGNYSSAINDGHRSSASNTGEYSYVTNKGMRSSATNTGDYSSASNKGSYSSALNNGHRSSASNTGNYSLAANIGNHSSSEVRGKNSIAAVFGKDCKVKGVIGCALFLTERGNLDDEAGSYAIKNVMAVIVDGVKVKENTWYMLVDGKLTECE